MEPTDPMLDGKQLPPMTDNADLIATLDTPPAHAAFRAWCKEQRGRRLGLARLLGLSGGTVGSWGRLENPNRPREPFHMFAVAEITGIPVQAWLSRADLLKLEPILQNWRTLVQAAAARPQKVDPRQLQLFDSYASRQQETLSSIEESGARAGTIDADYDDDESESAEDVPPTAGDFDPDAAMSE